MVIQKHFSEINNGSSNEEAVFLLIAKDLEQQGYSIRPDALPQNISNALYAYQENMNTEKYSEAGVGRRQDYLKTEVVRTDEICWITGESDAGSLWVNWSSSLQRYLNQHLFLGLFSFESHFAHYSPGAFYKKHYDAFRGETNRVLSLVTYLNPVWNTADGGELVLYRDDQDQDGIKSNLYLVRLWLFSARSFLMKYYQQRAIDIRSRDGFVLIHQLIIPLIHLVNLRPSE